VKILVPTVIPIEFTAPEGVSDVRYDVRAPIPKEHRDAEAIVLWLNPPAELSALPQQLPHLKWIQGLMAGPDAVHAAGFPSHVQVCAGVGLHDAPVAEHTMALILAAARRLDLTTRAQEESRWARELSGNQTVKRTGFTTLGGASVLVWGFGSIGQHLAPLLSAFGARVTGVANSAGTRAGYPVITPTDLPEYLPTTDVLVSILPGTNATAGIVNAEIFEALPSHAWFVNVGRGSVVDDSDLLTALANGTIAGAALDVFVEEPLPSSSPLWQAPNMIITPHTAGGRPQNPGERIEENLRRYLAGEELIGVSRP